MLIEANFIRKFIWQWHHSTSFNNIIQRYWLIFTICQNYLTLLNIIQHHSTLFAIIQHCATLLNVICRYSTLWSVTKHYSRLFNIVEWKPPRLLVVSHMNYSKGSPLPTKCLTFDHGSRMLKTNCIIKVIWTKQTNKQTYNY